MLDSGVYASLYLYSTQTFGQPHIAFSVNQLQVFKYTGPHAMLLHSLLLTTEGQSHNLGHAQLAYGMCTHAANVLNSLLQCWLA